jgi:hypothetical protein
VYNQVIHCKVQGSGACNIGSNTKMKKIKTIRQIRDGEG